MCTCLSVWLYVHVSVQACTCRGQSMTSCLPPWQQDLAGQETHYVSLELLAGQLSVLGLQACISMPFLLKKLFLLYFFIWVPRIQTQVLVFAEQALLPTTSPEAHVVHWICISLVTREVRHLFECSLAMRILENSLFNSFACLMIICSLAIQYKFWILISCQMTSWHSFFLILCLLLHPGVGFLCWRALNCVQWVPEQLVSFSESPFLCLDLQASLLHFPPVGSVFQVLYKCPWCFFLYFFFNGTGWVWDVVWSSAFECPVFQHHEPRVGARLLSSVCLALRWERGGWSV